MGIIRWLPNMAVVYCLAGAWIFGAATLGTAEDKVVTVTVQASSEAPGYEAYRALDGNPNSMWHTDWQYENPAPPHELSIDLGERYEIAGFTYLPRPGGGNGTIGRYEFFVSDDPQDLGRAVAAGSFTNQDGENAIRLDEPVTGRYVWLRALSEVQGRNWASVAGLRLMVPDVEFRGRPAVVAMETDELRRQFLALQHDLRRKDYFAEIADQAFRPDALIFPSDRDPADVVLRRTTALFEALQTTPAASALSELAEQLQELQDEGKAIDVDDSRARYALYTKACHLRRQIALANPLLDFDQIVFIKRHRALYNHMCDQYYGIAATPGGGLYVLEDAFGPDPQVRDLLADSVVQRGRLAGERLCGGPSIPPDVRYDGMGTRHGQDTGGSFLSPHLSYDAQQILFAYVENRGDPTHRHHTVAPDRGYWHEGRCYHIFRVNTDGSQLEQLTDGTWNDFDPVLMPSGRIVFNSERRGGYLRCGRVCPTYTLFDMAADGSDIRCLSYHETNEWHPSVAHDGMIMFTRWDYVDRHGVVAHHPWVITPDGCDPRAIHGNFSFRPERADMQLDIRAIPGSHRYVATAAPHHGQAFGSLVVFDPNVPDDDVMAPVWRLTPEIAFPESQGPTRAQVFGQATPLSEDFYLVVYDAAMEVPAIRGPQGCYGLYLLDSFGNRELLYRDPEIASQNPLPLRPRPVPPLVAERSTRIPADQPAEATVGVVNVYHSLMPWPDETQIKALRVYQILPLPVASARIPHNTGIQIPQGADSINLARSVLGTVPVEPDGSAYFTVPARRELYFQALDAQGLAVTSMRSATQFQPGEQATCLGCHEPRHDAVPAPTSPPLAMQRPPSPLMPDVDGTHPFSYPRLVQPILDKHCVACHREHADQAPPLDSSLVTHPGGGHMNRPTTYYQSYVSLAPEFGFYDYGGRGWMDPKWYRTTPGQFGARASRLYQMLNEGHHDVQLSPEELHRIVVWLDSCSLFYGVYEAEGGQAQLQGQLARPTLE
jgi:cytochrome c553